MEPSYPLVTVHVVPDTFVTNKHSVSMLTMKGVAGNPVDEATVTEVPDVVVMAAPRVVCAKLA